MKKILCLLVFQISGLLVAHAQLSFDNASLQDLQAYDAYMTETAINGNVDETNQLSNGTVLFYVTNEKRYGKMRIMEYGYNLNIDWITYGYNGEIYKCGGNLIIRGTWSCDLDFGVESSISADFWWEQKTEIVRNLVPKNNARFYKVPYPKKEKKLKPSVVTQPIAVPKKTKEQQKADNVETGARLVVGIIDALGKRKEDKQQENKDAVKETKQPKVIKGKEPKVITQSTEGEDKIVGTDAQGRTIYESSRGGHYYINDNGNKSYIKMDTNVYPSTPKKQPILTGAASITWQATLSNGSTTSTQTLELKACVETTETVKEYILIQNGQRLAISRGLISRKDNDCLNAFNQSVTLRNGENTFQLRAQLANIEVQSEAFIVNYDSNTNNNTQNAPPQYTSKRTRRLALVIGNSAYSDPKNALPNPINDATDMAAALREIGFDVLTVNNANKKQMTDMIDEFGRKISNYDIGFFYYAGHGLEVKGENYLMPIDAAPKTEGEVAYDCYPIGKLLAKFEASSNRANIIVLDACRNNPLRRSWNRSTSDKGLANMTAPTGTFIGFAAAPGQEASDGNGGRNGVYTSALLQHIRKPNLSIDQLFTAVCGTVQTMTQTQQVPQVPWKSSSFSKELYLTK